MAMGNRERRKFAHESAEAMALILLVGISAILFLPIFPIDETRSLSVAWEMWINKSFLVPLLHGKPYPHKPPLLFWLIHATWFLFGVNEVTPRLIPMFFGMVNIVLVREISLLLWPKEKSVAKYAPYFLSATLIWLVWSFLILYEMLLSFWVLLGVMGILRARLRGRKGDWCLISLSVAGGILTKGPVVFVHILPLILSVWWWGRLPKKQVPSWFGKAFLAVLMGLLVAGAWVVPAVLEGGERYRQALLWGQTVKRVLASFAHRRPIWWYLPLLPILFLPWTFWGRVWTGLFERRGERTMGTRTCLVWFFSSLGVLSLVSGKQPYYLLPSLPAVMLMMAHNFYKKEVLSEKRMWRPMGMGIVLLVVAGGTLLMPFVSISANMGKVPWSAVLPMTTLSGGFGLYLLFHPFSSGKAALRTISLCVALVLSVFMAAPGRVMLKSYDLKPFAKRVKVEMEKGNEVTYIGGYHGEFQFLGRLEKPVKMLKGKTYQNYLKTHPNSLVIDEIETQKAKGLNGKDVRYWQPYKGRKVLVLMQGATYLKYFGR